jgi:hypothetical protein
VSIEGEKPVTWVSVILALTVPGALVIAYVKTQGIGWALIRYTVLAIAIPVTAILTLNDSLTEGAAAIIAAAIGYAFGKSSENSDRSQEKENSDRSQEKAE